MDSTLKAFATNPINLFLISSHGPTSSTTCYILNALSTHRETFAGTQTKHNEILCNNAHVYLSYSIQRTPNYSVTYPIQSRCTRKSFGSILQSQAFALGSLESTSRTALIVIFRRSDFSTQTNPQILHRHPTYWPRLGDILPAR